MSFYTEQLSLHMEPKTFTQQTFASSVAAKAVLHLQFMHRLNSSFFLTVIVSLYNITIIEYIVERTLTLI